MPMKKKKSSKQTNGQKTAGKAIANKNDNVSSGILAEHTGMSGFSGIGKNAGILLNTTKSYFASLLKV